MGVFTENNFSHSKAHMINQMLANAQAIVEQTRSDWHQHYEHRGLMLQKRVQSKFEAKILVVFGHCVGGTLEAMHRRTDSSGQQLKLGDNFSVAFYYDKVGHAECCEGDSTATCPGSQRPMDRRYASMFHSHDEVTHQLDVLKLASPALRAICSRVANALGADYFRLDAFVDEKGHATVNELTYPSHTPPAFGG